MPPSQLKRLKQSLREQGVVRPQPSKKSRRNAKNDPGTKQSLASQNARLQAVRDEFNPFELKQSNAPKFAVVGSNVRQQNGLHRPGATKSVGEEKRRNTLFVEMQKRKKTGGITDRRFGENDPHLTPEQKSLQRFVRERETAGRKASIFDLEDPIEDETLTHLGQSLPQSTSEEEPIHNGHQQGNLEWDQNEGRAKRRRFSPSESESDQDHDLVYDPNSQTKTKKEAMEEMIAKSKLKKYERQKEKEDDDDLRAELDKGLSDIFSALRNDPKPELIPGGNLPPKSAAQVNPERQALIEAKDREQADKEYDERLRQMVIEQRARPAMPTVTEEEKLQRQAQKIKALEEERLRRMRGDLQQEDIEQQSLAAVTNGDMDVEELPEPSFGLGDGLLTTSDQTTLGVEDEDEFVIDDDIPTDNSDNDSDTGRQHSRMFTSEEDEDGLSAESSHHDNDDTTLAVLEETAPGISLGASASDAHGCPSTLEEFLQLTKGVDSRQVPLIVQRLRAIYHPRLNSENKTRLAKFAPVLIEYIHYSTTKPKLFNSVACEALIRHIHSLAKMFPAEVGNAFRAHLRQIGENRPTSLDQGDLMILTAISSIFPTSDHFHPVVTPAMLCMTRYLSQSPAASLLELAIGTFVSTLCLQYQGLAQRYVAEVLNYIGPAFEALLPAETEVPMKQYPDRTLPTTLRMKVPSPSDETPEEALSLSYRSIVSPPSSDMDREMLKSALLFTLVHLIDTMTDLYQSKSSYCEILAPIARVLKTVCQAPEAGEVWSTIREKVEEVNEKLQTCLNDSAKSRKHLAMHKHRPLPIKASLPKFDESFNPDKHNDPDADRAELSKLKAQHKQEKKGALRELRKDARFMAREDLREKKEKDAAYEKKFKRLVAEIQGEEGHESKVYEKKKRKRLGKR